jgi:hypothetical protein
MSDWRDSYQRNGWSWNSQQAAVLISSARLVF